MVGKPILFLVFLVIIAYLLLNFGFKLRVEESLKNQTDEMLKGKWSMVEELRNISSTLEEIEMILNIT